MQALFRRRHGRPGVLRCEHRFGRHAGGHLGVVDALRRVSIVSVSAAAAAAAPDQEGGGGTETHSEDIVHPDTLFSKAFLELFQRDSTAG